MTAIDELFARYQRTSDPRDLARVFDATASKLYSLAIHLVGRGHDAEDLVQATFVTILERAEQYRGHGSFLSWANRILANQARMARRQRRRRRLELTEFDEASGFADERSNIPDLAAADAELRDRLREAIACEPPAQARVLHLRLIDERGYDEIAELLGLPPATVRTRMRRGLMGVRSRMPTGLVSAGLWFEAGTGFDTLRQGLTQRAASLAAPGAESSIRPPVSSAKAMLSIAAILTLAPVAWFALRSSTAPSQPQVITSRDVADIRGAAARSEATGASIAPGVTELQRALVEVAEVGAPAVRWQLRGRVRDRVTAQAVAGANVAASILFGCDRVALPVVTADAGGRFVVDVRRLAERGELGMLGASLLVECDAPGYWPASEVLLDIATTTDQERATWHCDVAVQAGAVIRGRVVADGGSPYVGSLQLVQRQHGSPVVAAAEAADGGWFIVPRLGAGRMVELIGTLGRARCAIDEAAGLDVDLGTVVLAAGSLRRLRLVDAVGEELPHATVQIAGDGTTLATSDASGVVRIADVDESVRSIQLLLMNGLVSEPVRLSPEACEVAFAVRAIHVEVRDVASGDLVAGVPLRVDIDGERLRHDVSDVGGVFEVVVPAAATSIAVGVDDWRLMGEAVSVASMGATRPAIVVRVRLPRGDDAAQIALRMADGLPDPERLQVVIAPVDDELATPRTIGLVQLSQVRLPAGRYRLFVESTESVAIAQRVHTEAVEFEAEAGGITEIASGPGVGQAGLLLRLEPTNGASHVLYPAVEVQRSGRSGWQRLGFLQPQHPGPDGSRDRVPAGTTVALTSGLPLDVVRVRVHANGWLSRAVRVKPKRGEDLLLAVPLEPDAASSR